MNNLSLQQDEMILARAQAQLAKGFPQTAGNLYLTNMRLILVPDQFLSLLAGEYWEIPLSRILKAQKLGRFQGGTFIGGAGKKLVVHLIDPSIYINGFTVHTFSFALWSDIDTFFDILTTQLKQSLENEQVK
ncbi:MAG: hypothetical protein AB1564_07170 [Chloroflexota bacterium]